MKTLFELLGLRLENRVTRGILDPEQIEQNERHIEAIFRSMCHYIPDLLTLDEEHIFVWDKTNERAVNLNDFPVLDRLGVDCRVTLQHVRAYKSHGVTRIPVNLVYLCLYDLLLEYNYPLTPTIRGLLASTVTHYAPAQTSMEQDLLRIYLTRFTPNIKTNFAREQLNNAREPFVNGVAKQLHTFKTGPLTLTF